MNLVGLIGGGAQWRRDGREFFYLGLNNRVMAVPIAISESTLKAGTPHAPTTAAPGGVWRQPTGSGSSYRPLPQSQRPSPWCSIGLD